MNTRNKKSRFRFSLRFVMCVLTIAAFATYWLIRPGFVAAKFFDHINAHEFDKAVEMFRWKTDFSHYWESLAKDAKEQDRKIFAHWQRPTLANILDFEREITLESNTTGFGMSSQVQFKSTPTHVTLRPRVPSL